MKDEKNKKEFDDKLDSFLGDDQDIDCDGEECVIKTDKSLLERINKKIVTDDGRELLM